MSAPQHARKLGSSTTHQDGRNNKRLEGIETAIAGEAIGLEDYHPSGGFEHPIEAYNPPSHPYDENYV